MIITFIALPLVSMGSKNAASDAIAVMKMNKPMVTCVLETSNVCSVRDVAVTSMDMYSYRLNVCMHK